MNLTKKVGGVPVVYLAALFVGILVVIAWRMKPAADQSGDPATGDDVEGDPSLANGVPVFIANPTPPYSTPDPATTDPVTVDDNNRWAKRATEWLVATGQANGGDAQLAMNEYINGAQLSYAQGKLRDAAIKQYGIPPEPLTPGGTSAPNTIPTKQGNPPTTHVVKGSNDNDFWKLAKLYYGSDHYDYVNTLEVANLSIRKGRNHLPVGTSVKIPKYGAPKYFLTNIAGMSAQQIAQKNGTTAAAITEFNDSIKFPVARKGTRIRVA